MTETQEVLVKKPEGEELDSVEDTEREAPWLVRMRERMTALEEAANAHSEQEVQIVELRLHLRELATDVDKLCKRYDMLKEQHDMLRETIGFLIEGAIVANQGSSEWCLRYLQRAVERDYITRDFAQTLLFNVIRVDGYWRTRFGQMMPEKG